MIHSVAMWCVESFIDVLIIELFSAMILVWIVAMIAFGVNTWENFRQ